MKQTKLEPFINKTITVSINGAFLKGVLQPFEDTTTITLVGIYSEKKELRNETCILDVDSIDGIILDGGL